MSIMQQSSKAQDRSLGVWFQLIQQGQIKLPRFQRPGDAWDRGRVSSFLSTVINNLPVGVTLALEVAGTEKFVSRYLETADPEVPGQITQHLLDGQQRLTVFWRAMHNNYEKETYFVYLPDFDLRSGPKGEMDVRCQPRWRNKLDLAMPRWADEPAQCLEHGLLPISLLRPGDIASKIDIWLDNALQPLKPAEADPDAFKKYRAYSANREKIKSEIITLRERVTHFNLPYLSLPSETEKEVALTVFINMNTNSQPLKLYEIIVAEIESIAGTSLPSRAEELKEKVPHAPRFGDISNLILSTSALLQDHLPNTRGMTDMDKPQLLENWPKLERGLDRMTAFLAGQGVFDEARLPTNAVLAVIAAAYDQVPEHGDFVAKSEKLLRRYLWSSFFTDRYENSAASRAYADFSAIKALLQKPQFSDTNIETVPVLNRAEYPLADADSLVSAGWPKPAGIEARGTLAVTTYFGAYDFADDKRAAYESIQTREYHHVFPDALLSEVQIASSLALNCALITWKTNRLIGRKDPLEYLENRVEWADEATIEKRLRSHLISYDRLKKAHYEHLIGEALKTVLETDFQAFLRDRAALFEIAVTSLAGGNQISLDELWLSYAEQKQELPEGVPV